LAAVITFYLYENVQVAIADQLRRRGIDVVTARDIGALGETDKQQLERARQMGRVLCTHDSDYVKMAMEGISHAGNVFGQHDTDTIGDWVETLELIHAVLTPDDMRDHVEYV
jgi:hypothetical protein